jgi:hypothetical protein
VDPPDQLLGCGVNPARKRCGGSNACRTAILT